jgi:hypothetical protein
MQTLANAQGARPDLRNIPKILRRNDSYPARPQSGDRPAAARTRQRPIPPGLGIIAIAAGPALSSLIDQARCRAESHRNATLDCVSGAAVHRAGVN